MEIAETLLFFVHLVLGIQSTVTLETIVEESPFQVSLLRVRKNKYEHLAGGTVIASEWIVTAAHFFESSKYLIENLAVIHGMNNITRNRPSHEQIRTIVNYYFPDLYLRHGKVYIPRFALVKLKEKFDSPKVRPIGICWDKAASSNDEQADLYRWKKKYKLLFFPFWRSYHNLVQTKMDLNYSIEIGEDRIVKGDAYVATKAAKTYAGAAVLYESKLLAIINRRERLDKTKIPIETIITERRFLKEFIPNIIDSEDTSESAETNVLETEKNVRDTSFQALIEYPYPSFNPNGRSYQGICMGIIVHLRWVLTLATTILKFNRDIREFRAVAGQRNTALLESNVQRRQCDARYIPREFADHKVLDDENKVPLFNFALIELKEPFEEKPFVNPIKICWNQTDLIGRDVIVYSWIFRKIEKATYHQLIQETVKIESATSEDGDAEKLLRLSVPLNENRKGGNIIVYDNQLMGLTGWIRYHYKFNDIILEMGKVYDFIVQKIPDQRKD